MQLVLTSSSSGIGRDLTGHRLVHGHQVWGLSRSDQGAVARSHPGFRFSQCEVATWPRIERAVAVPWIKR